MHGFALQAVGPGGTTTSELAQRGEEPLGAERLAALEDGLEAMAGAGGMAKLGDLPGWMR
ncbi:MAG: hypothetical protein ACXVFT_02420 [Solirubrobacteraceae bacterium]